MPRLRHEMKLLDGWRVCQFDDGSVQILDYVDRVRADYPSTDAALAGIILFIKDRDAALQAAEKMKKLRDWVTCLLSKKKSIDDFKEATRRLFG
jgi:hypothetical protein